MFDEPFRWTEAIATRHSYVQGKLKKAQPVIAVPYNEGALILGFCPQPGKIFEIYDRIAMGGMGHPADLERLRMILLDMAHLEGFNRSVQDVTLARLLQFGIAPALKQNFEEVMRAPYLVQLAFVEVDLNGTPNFFRLNYDGHWEAFKNGTVIGGSKKMVEWMEKEIDKRKFASIPLDQALAETCRLWEEGRKLLDEEEKDGIPATLKEAFEKWVLDAAVLCKTSTRKSIFRRLAPTEIEALRGAVNA